MYSSQNQSLTQRLVNASWKVRKEAYQQILYLLMEEKNQIIFANEAFSVQKIVILLNHLPEQQNTTVLAEGLKCLKYVLKSYFIKISCLNYFMTESIEKCINLNKKIREEIQDIFAVSIERYQTYVFNLLIAKFQNKNPKTLLFIVCLIQTHLKNALKSKEIINYLYRKIQPLACHSNKEIKLISVDISNTLEKYITKTTIVKPYMKQKSTNDLLPQKIQFFDQMTIEKKIEISTEFREKLQRYGNISSGELSNLEQNFNIMYNIRLMIQDSNQLLWTEGIKILQILIKFGIKLKDIGYILDKYKNGKNSSNQLILDLFDNIIIYNSKKFEQHVSCLTELFNSTNKQNIKTCIIFLMIRIVYLTHLINSNDETCKEIEETYFSKGSLFCNFQNGQENEDLKNKLIIVYNKVIKKFLTNLLMFAKYKQTAQNLLVYMKPFNKKITTQNENIINNPPKEVKKKNTNLRGFDKLVSEIILFKDEKDLTKKIQECLNFVRQKKILAYSPFYIIDIINKFISELAVKILPSYATDLISNHILKLLHQFSQYEEIDNQSAIIFLQILLSKLAFGKSSQKLIQIFENMKDKRGWKYLGKLFEKLLNMNNTKFKKKSLKILYGWLCTYQKKMKQKNILNVIDWLQFKQSEQVQTVNNNKNTIEEQKLKKQHEKSLDKKNNQQNNSNLNKIKIQQQQEKKKILRQKIKSDKFFTQNFEQQFFHEEKNEFSSEEKNNHDHSGYRNQQKIQKSVASAKKVKVNKQELEQLFKQSLTNFNLKRNQLKQSLINHQEKSALNPIHNSQIENYIKNFQEIKIKPIHQIQQQMKYNHQSQEEKRFHQDTLELEYLTDQDSLEQICHKHIINANNNIHEQQKLPNESVIQFVNHRDTYQIPIGNVQQQSQKKDQQQYHQEQQDSNTKQQHQNQECQQQEHYFKFFDREELEIKLIQPMNTYFYLKTQIYTKFHNLSNVDQKREFLNEMNYVIQNFNISDNSFNSILILVFLLFIEIKNTKDLIGELQEVYQSLRALKPVQQFFVILIKNIKKIIENGGDQKNSLFLANIISKSVMRLSAFIQKSQQTQILYEINQFFQLGEVIYFEIYKNQYQIIKKCFFDIYNQWSQNYNKEDLALVYDNFENFYDNEFKNYVLNSKKVKN